MKLKRETYINITGVLGLSGSRRVVIFTILLTILSAQILRAQSEIPLIQPPYAVKTGNVMSMMLQLNASEAQTLLPADVKVKSDENEMATISLEIYSTDQISGVANYSIAFVTIEVGEQESNYGKPGSWSVWGVMNNDTTLHNFRTHYNFPYQLERNIQLQNNGTEYAAVIGKTGHRGLSVKMVKDTARPILATGTGSMLSKSPNGKFLRTEIPWLADGYQSNILSLEIQAGDDKVLKVLKNAKPVYSQVSANAFCYTRSLTH